MHFKFYRIMFLIIILITLILIMPKDSFSSNNNQTYIFHTKIGNNIISHKLYISIPSSLYDYYQRQNHYSFNMDEFSKFVTPKVFMSIAENIRNVTRNLPYSDEAFANAVLEIVHQIPYKKTNIKFPTETIVDNSGDCDTLSLLAASIMKAGELDVVLLFYENSPVHHMNVGVHLSDIKADNSAEMKYIYHEYDDKKYYTAETTGENWKVGEQPQIYINTEPKIIPIKNYEKTSFVEISSNLENPLIPSSISLSLIPESLKVEEEGTNITISGSISPRYPKQQVTINIKYESSPKEILKTVTTDELGDYSVTCNFKTMGLYSIQTSWNGAQNFAGSTSEELTVKIGLKQLLDKYETYQTITVASETIQKPILNSTANLFLSNQPIKQIFEKNFTGTGILMNSEFIILGKAEPYLIEQRITIPEHEQIIILKSGRLTTRTVPEQTIIISNYRQHMHNHLEFSLVPNSNEDFTLSVRFLDNNDMSQVIDNSDSTVINASNHVRENIWYEIATSISENQIFVKLIDKNNTNLTKIIPVNLTESVKELKILIKYEPDSIIVFKNLCAEIIDQPTQLIEGYGTPFIIPRNQSLETPEIEEPPETPELDMFEPEESVQALTFPTTIVFVVAVSLATLITIIFRLYKAHK
jgi:hypothetical protein